MNEPYFELTSSEASVTFQVPHTEASDTAVTTPVQFWLEVFPTADEEAPD